jgi:hypothetical protein
VVFADLKRFALQQGAEYPLAGGEVSTRSRRLRRCRLPLRMDR